jgi:hypothetical protein
MTIDPSSWWWRKGRAGLGIFIILLAAGIIFEPLQNRAWSITRANQPELHFKDLGDNLGQGTLLGVFGGFRNILADFAWLRGYTYWEQRDQPNTETMLNLATTLDPRVVMFWTTGAGEIAYDMPAWPLREKPPPADDELKKIHDEQARRGLEFLDRGLQFLPDNYSLLLNKAEIYQNRLNDLADAAEQYRLAAENTKEFFFPMRQYIILLYFKLGRQHEAYDYLKNRYPTLPENVPDAQKGAMWEMIQLMENDLKIPPTERAGYPKPANYESDSDFDPLPGLSLHN